MGRPRQAARKRKGAFMLKAQRRGGNPRKRSLMVARIEPALFPVLVRDAGIRKFEAGWAPGDLGLHSVIIRAGKPA